MGAGLGVGVDENVYGQVSKPQSMIGSANKSVACGSRDVSFDIGKIQMNKQMNIQQAFQSNLKAKKQEIIELEGKYQ